MKRIILSIVLAGLGLAMAGVIGSPVEAACEGGHAKGGDGDPKGDGNEVVGVYVGEVPVDLEILDNLIETDRVWVEVQDDGEHAPVNAEVGWQGVIYVPELPPPAPSGAREVVGCSDTIIDGLDDPDL